MKHKVVFGKWTKLKILNVLNISMLTNHKINEN